MRDILVVEDSPEHQKLVARVLGSFHLSFVESAEEAWVKLSARDYDLILLDISLPNKDGYTLLAEIQSLRHLQETPIICLTGKSGITDKITAFTLGADDYVVKPFDPLELKARVEGKISKRHRIKTSSLFIEFNALRIDLTTQRVFQGENREPLELTPIEFRLLSKLTSWPERVFTRDQLLIAGWGENASVLDRAVDVHICGLRKKLGSIGSCIEAISGTGYRISEIKFKKLAA